MITKNLNNFIFLLFLLIMGLFPLLCHAQQDFEFGKTEQQVKNELAVDPECTFVKKEFINNGSLSVLIFYLSDGDLESKRYYYFNKNNRMVKWAETYPIENLQNLYLLFSNSDVYTKVDEVTYYNNITKTVVNVKVGSNYCGLMYEPVSGTRLSMKRTLSTHK